MKLYELSQSYNQLLDMADQLDSEVLKDTLAAIKEPLEDKIESTAKFIRCLESDVTAIKEEEKRLADKRKTLENRISNVKDYLKNEMEFAGLNKVKRPTITVSLQLNPPSVEVLDESIVPSAFMVPQDPKIDKKAILKALKDGEEVPGCEIEQKKGLRIR